MKNESEKSQVEIVGDGNVVGDESVSQVVKAEGGTIGDVHIGNKVYAYSNLEELDGYLSRAVATFEAQMYRLVAYTSRQPEQPYKFLYAFKIEDEGIFFGRDVASKAFSQTVVRDRLTVLHAKSGAGKTSLINAGLSPYLIRKGCLPVYARAYEDPVRAVKRAIASPSLGPWPEILHKLTLHEFLGLACAHLSRQTQELAVVLDQFEEFFIFWPKRDHRQPFIDALGDCYDDKSLPVRFIVALRKDYYSDLANFQCRLPHVFHNEYYLEAMTREEAQAAIIEPVAKLDRSVIYEQALLETLLRDLDRGGIELPHLQIICTRLYETLNEGEMTITLASYEDLGRAEGVLGGYLNNVLDRLPDGERAVAKEVLQELVSSEATKRVLGHDKLAARIEAGGNELTDVLARLVDARLLRRDEVAGEVVYEMVHEYLIEEIRGWIDQADLMLKYVEELLTREVANWRVHGTLIPRDRLELLHTHRERLRGLDDASKECLLRSALQAKFAVEDWARLADEFGERLLLGALSDPREEMRRAATRGLGTIWGLPQVSKLADESAPVRQEAVRVLGGLSDPRVVELLIAALRDQDRFVRLVAASVLGDFGDPRAVEALIATLRDENNDVVRMAASALIKIGEPTVEPLIVTLQDEDNNVRRVAASVLGDLGDSRAVEPLTAILGDQDRFVCRAAAEALKKIGTPEALEVIGDALSILHNTSSEQLLEENDWGADYIRSKMPQRVCGLGELVRNLWWSWHRGARDLFKMVDYPLWRSTDHNPVRMLREVSPERLEELATDPLFLRQYDAVLMALDADLNNGHLWFPTRYPELMIRPIAYFSAEFGLHQSVPIYSSGLGVLAGDCAKEASDLGLPFVGVGILYRQGDFRQCISSEGWQEADYMPLNLSEVPIYPVLDEKGERLRVEVQLDMHMVHIQVWHVQAGSVRLYLMDTDTEANDPWDRELSHRLHIDDREMCIKQEIILGIGGLRVLRALGIDPLVFHLNEGHSAFLVLERVRELVADGQSFDEARQAVQTATVFTTHTPVLADHDVFPFHLVEKYFHTYWPRLGLSREQFLQLGCCGSDQDDFNMTVLALCMCGQRNGVSKLHGEVSRHIWQAVWPEKPVDEVPISHITNGIHVPFWIGEAMNRIYRKYIGPDWIERHDDPVLWERILDVPDEELWAAHLHLKRKLMTLIRERARRRRRVSETIDSGQALTAGTFLDPDALIIGYAGRLVTYKRATLIFHDVERLKELVHSRYRPVQLIFAGKANPADEEASRLLQQVCTMAKDPATGGRIAFVEDYDMQAARYLVQGVDVWLNTSRPPFEASGTSGIKAAINGVPNLGVLTGWWAEGYNAVDGWAVEPLGEGDPGVQDAHDAEALYRLLEEDVVPLFYKRDADGVPRGWVQVMKEAIHSVAPVFCARRMVKEYIERLYVPAARAAWPEI